MEWASPQDNVRVNEVLSTNGLPSIDIGKVGESNVDSDGVAKKVGQGALKETHSLPIIGAPPAEARDPIPVMQKIA